MARGRAEVTVRLLGEVSVLCEGRTVALPQSRKTRALFVFLLLTAREHRRERLCELFWDLPDDPRGALRWSLSKLRTTLGDCADWIIADRDHVRCDAPPHATDLRRIEALIARDDPGDGPEVLASARVALDPPLTGVELPNNGDYMLWLRAERARAERCRVALLRRAAGLTCDGEEAAMFRSIADGIEPVPERSELSVRPEPPPATRAIRYCTASDGCRIAFAEMGEGPVLVKAANWLNHLELDLQSPVWGRLFRSLADGRRFVRYDERGNGLSDWDVGELSFDAFVRDLETVVDGLGLERFDLLGISQGCAVSIEYTARHPERVNRLVLVGGYAAGWRAIGDDDVRAQAEAIITLARTGWGADNPVFRQIFSQMFMPSATPEELAWFNDFQRRTATPENAVRFLQAFADIDVRDRLVDVHAPTLVLHSRGDQRVPLNRGIELAAGIADAMLVTLESDSHLPLAREPATELMIERVGAFLAE